MQFAIFLNSAFLEQVKQADRWLFRKINTVWINDSLDAIFPIWREAISWAPLYVFLIAFMLINYGKKAWPWIIGVILTAAITDQVSSHLIKPWIARPRPCHDMYLIDSIRLLLNKCSNSFSFTSSHATNHFGAAFFIYHTAKSVLGKWSYFFFFWAASISYGQVYVGVHYPVDVCAGAIMGSIIGTITAYLYKAKWQLNRL